MSSDTNAWSIWTKYGWKGPPTRPWWVIESDGHHTDLVRKDCPQLRIREHNVAAGTFHTAKDMCAQAEALDKKYPLRCPEVAVGQVWHFPKADVDVLVIYRRGEAYVTTGPDIYVHDTLQVEDCGTNTTKEYTSVPPVDYGETAWLVYGPGAPWAPMTEEDP